MATINLTTGNDVYINNSTDGSNSIEGGAGDDIFGLSGTYGTDNDTINGGDGIDMVVLHTVDSNADWPGGYIIQTGVDRALGTPYFQVEMRNGVAQILYASFTPDLGISASTAYHTYRYSLSNIEKIWTNTASASNIIEMVSSDNIERSISGGDGSDRIKFVNYEWSVISGQIQVLTSTARHNIWGGGGNDTISVMGFVVVDGGSGDDTIKTGEVLSGSSLSGGDGNDTIYCGNNNVLASGGNGNDFLSSLGHSSAIHNDAIDGVTATLDGGAGNDVLSGSGGHEVFIGGAGNDEIRSYTHNGGITLGWTGSDTYQFGFGDGQDLSTRQKM